MAEIRRISRSPALSSFSQVGRTGGGSLLVLADAAKAAYDVMLPYGVEEMAQRGDEATAAQLAQRTIGLPPPVPVAGPRPSAGGGSTNGTVANPGAPVGEPPVAASGSPPAVTTSRLSDLVDRTEGGGGYDTLFGYSQREGGRFAGVDVSSMTVGEVLDFTDPSGDYGQWVAGQVGRVATPTGRYQIVGSTLRRAAEEAGIPLDARFDQRTQDQLFARLVTARISGPRTMDGKIAALRQEWEGFKNVPDAQLAAAITDFEQNGILPPAPGGSASSASTGSRDTPEALAADTRAALGLSSPASNPPPAAPPPVVSAPPMSSAPPMASAPPPAPPPTMVRTSDGTLAPRLYPPTSDPMMQAYNAAATMTWMTDALLNGRTDLMGLSTEMAMNPSGFQQASQAYIAETVAAAPAMLRRDLRAKLMDEANGRYLGMVDEQQADIRQRSANSNQALVDRYGEDYATRLAAGDTEGATRAQALLEEALYARESLPGLAWTRDQSINAVMAAQDNAQRMTETRRAAQEAEYKAGLNTIIAARENGMVAEQEGLLDDPAVWAALPELASEAAAKVSFQEAVPSFNALPPSQQAAAIAEMRAQPVGAEWNIDLVKAAEDIATANAAAWADDPIARAAQVLPDAPPPLPPPDAANPQGFIEGLAARRAYGTRLAAQGYTETPVFLSDTESTALAGLMSQDVPAEGRLFVAAALAQGFGDDASRVFDGMEIDPVTAFAGKLLSRGGSMPVATEMVRGQQMIDEGLALIPEKATRIEAFAPDVATALASVPGDPIAISSEVLAAATAVYAARNPGLAPDDSTAGAKMTEAVNAALGQSTDSRGRAVGGVQTILGQPVLLPVDVAGEDVDAALRGMGARPRDPFMGLPTGPAPDATAFWAGASPEDRQAQGVPFAYGAPVTPALLRRARLIPIGGNSYRMEIQIGSAEPADVATADGATFVVDIKRLAELGLNPPRPVPASPVAPIAPAVEAPPASESGPPGSGPRGSGPPGSGPLGAGPQGSGPRGSGPRGTGTSRSRS